MEPLDNDGINWKVLVLLFGWVSSTNLAYQLKKFKTLWKEQKTDFAQELEPFVLHATHTGLPSCYDVAACVVEVEKFFQEHEKDYLEAYIKRRTADVNDDRKPRAKRSRGNDQDVAAAPGLHGAAAAAAAASVVDEGTAAPASDSAATDESTPGVAEVVVKQGDAANSPLDDASSPSVSVRTGSPHSRTLDSAAVPIEHGGSTGSPSDDSSNLRGRATGVDAEQVVEHGRAMSVDAEQVAEHGRAMSVDAEQVVKHGGATGSTSEDSSKLRGSDMSVDAQDRMLP